MVRLSTDPYDLESFGSKAVILHRSVLKMLPVSTDLYDLEGFGPKALHIAQIGAQDGPHEH